LADPATAAPAAGPAPVDAYLLRLRTERGCSPRTLEAYGRELGVLAGLAEGRGWAAVTEADVRRWAAGAVREGLSPTSVARRLSAWRGFFDWLAGRGDVPANPARGVRAPRRPRRLPKALAPDLALRLMQPSEAMAWAVDGAVPDADPADGAAQPVADAATFERVRDQAVIELLYSSGLRLSELTGLDAHHVDLPSHRSLGWLQRDEAQVQVLGKGGKRRVVPVGAPALAALDAWLALRRDWLALHTGADPHALFLARRGPRLSNRAVQRLVRKLAIERGVPAKVHPHVLRHSFASHLLQSSGDLRAVQELLGHASIASTQIYTALDFQRLAAVYDAAHPRARARR
jgi:integrase/recombinase XerC